MLFDSRYKNRYSASSEACFENVDKTHCTEFFKKKNYFIDFENYLQAVKNCPQIFWILLIYAWTCVVVDDQYCTYQIMINIERLGFTYEDSRFIMAVKTWLSILASMGIGYFIDKYQHISKWLIIGSLLGVIQCVS